MNIVELTKADVKVLVASSICKTPCLVTDESISFRFSCNPKLLVLFGMFDSVDHYMQIMSSNRNVLYFDRRIIWDIDDDLRAVVDLRDDNGIVNSIMVGISGGGKEFLKDILRGRLWDNTPKDVFSDPDLTKNLSKMASIQMATPLLGLK